MKNYRPSFGTIFIGLFALLLGTGALLTAFGFNVFFSPRLNFHLARSRPAHPVRDSAADGRIVATA